MTPCPTVRRGAVRGGEAVRRGKRGGEARTEMSPYAEQVSADNFWPGFSGNVGRTQNRLGIVREARSGLFVTCRGGEGAGLGSGAVWGGAGGGGGAERRERGRDAHVDVSAHDPQLLHRQRGEVVVAPHLSR